jgi:hypothetical protein
MWDVRQCLQQMLWTAYKDTTVNARFIRRVKFEANAHSWAKVHSTGKYEVQARAGFGCMTADVPSCV